MNWKCVAICRYFSFLSEIMYKLKRVVCGFTFCRKLSFKNVILLTPIIVEWIPKKTTRKKNLNVYIISLKPVKFPDKCLGFRFELVNELTKIVPSTFGPFIGHHLRLLACIKINFLRVFWKEFFLGFYNITKLPKCRFGKTEMLMNIKNRTINGIRI